MTNTGLLTKKEALEKIEEILRTFKEEVYAKLNRANKNDEKIKPLTDSLVECGKKLSDEKFSYNDVALIFIAAKKLAEDYKLSWLNNRTDRAKITNKDLRVLNSSTGLTELIGDDIESIKEFLNELENEDYEELFELTPESERLSLLRHMIKGSDNFKNETYLKLEKAIMKQADFSKTIDIITQKGIVFYGMPLQQNISNGLGVAGNWLLDHNKFYFFGIPWLLGKGIKKGDEILRELDIPKLAGKVVFTRNVLENLSSNMTNENKEILKESISELSTEAKVEIEDFLKMGKGSEYDISNLNSKLYIINVSELNKLNLPGLIYNGSKKFDYSFSSSINTSGLGDFATLKSAPADYVFNLIQKEMVRADIGINAGKIGNFSNSFSINLFDEENTTTKPFSFLIKDLTKLWSYSTLEKLGEAIKTTDAGITNVSTYNKDNLALSLGGTVKTSGTEEIGGVQYENNNFATTNIVTLEQGEDKKLTKIDVKNQFSAEKDSANVVLGDTIDFSPNETNEKINIKELCLYSGISLNFSELDKKLRGQGEDEAIKDVLLRFGVTYTRNYVEQKNGYKISTDFKCSAFDGTINVGLAVDSSEIKNNKMKISYEYRGK